MNPKPSLLPVNSEAIPAELRNIAAWVGWKSAVREGRWTKEPIEIRTGQLAETDNPATWCDFQSVIDKYQQVGCDGIGLCRTGDQVFVDLDGVLDSTGAVRAFPWASAILSTVQGRAYIERSATGTGAPWPSATQRR